MSLKFTKYFLEEEDAEGNLLLLNTYNGCFVKVSYHQKEEVLNLINNSEVLETVNSTLIEKLKKTSFLLNDKVDEEKRAESKYIEICSSKRSLELIIMPTEECNFRCIYCYEDFSKGRMGEKTQKDIIRYVKRELKHYESLNVEWFGGEPLLSLDIIENMSSEFKAICKAQKKVYSAGMTTNGFLLTVDVFKRLFKCNVTKYQITLDGPQEIHDQQRVLINLNGTYNVIMDNLTNIRDMISSKLFIISIRSNLMKNMDTTKLNEYCAILEKEFGKDNRFVYDDFNMAWDPTENKNLEDKIYDKNEFIDIIKKNNIKRAKFLYGIMNGGIICYASKKSSIVIGSDGSLYKCNVAFEKDINKIGKLLDGGYMQIDFDKLLYWTARSESDRKRCSTCPLLPSCYGMRCPNKKNTQDCDEVINDIKYAMRSAHDIALIIN